MKNRYNNILRKNNQAILELVPYNPFLFTIGAKEIQKLYKKGMRILEIGAGEGDSALPVLKHTKANLDLLDVSKEMLAIAKAKLREYKERTKYICEDAYIYLKKCQPYDVIFAAWTVHNFKQKDKEKLFKAIYLSLAPKGTFILLDKVYPIKGGTELLNKQIERNRRYLNLKVAKAIIEHEIEDASKEYRMDEKSIISVLTKIGFKVTILDRIERDVVLIAKKS